MFGYMNDVKVKLNTDEIDWYRTYYCRLCNALSIRYGYRSRILVNYDTVVYMILTKMGMQDSFFCYKHKCQAKHLCGMKEFKADELGQFFSILVAQSVRISIVDKLLDGGKKKYKLFRFFFRKVFKAQDEKEKQLDEKATAKMQALEALEKQNLDLDTYLEYYGDSVLMCIREYYPALPAPYARLIGLIAKWTNYMDMLEDYDEDRVEGAFNPLICEEAPTLNDYVAKRWRDIRDVIYPMTEEMNVLLAQIRPKEYSKDWEVLAKVIKLVIPHTTKKILSCQPKKKRFTPAD